MRLGSELRLIIVVFSISVDRNERPESCCWFIRTPRIDLSADWSLSLSSACQDFGLFGISDRVSGVRDGAFDI